MNGRLVDMLRGDHRSIRARFLRGPALSLQFLLLYRALGRSRLDFIADRLDHAQQPLCETPYPEAFDAGEEDVARLKAIGLRPHHMLLDYGSGFFRRGLSMIRYMQPGHYVGADISRYVQRRAVARAEAAEVPRSHYHLVVVRDDSLVELAGFRFDFVTAISVLHYLTDAELVATLRSIRGLLAPTGQMLAYFPPPDMRLEHKGQVSRTVARAESLCRDAGFVRRAVEDANGAFILRLGSAPEEPAQTQAENH